jgi:hypothetical protein
MTSTLLLLLPVWLLLKSQSHVAPVAKLDSHVLKQDRQVTAHRCCNVSKLLLTYITLSSS